MTIAQLKAKIIEWIKTGEPKNIKSYNMRSLLQDISKKLPDVENFALNKIYAIGKDGDELKSTEINPVEYTFQSLTQNQQIQALENMGLKSILIEGKRFLFFKKPGNSSNVPQAGDTASLGWDGTSNFTIALRYLSGNPELFSSWINVSGDNAATGRLKTPEWETIAPNGQWNFPPAVRDDSFMIKVVHGNGSQNPNGVFWLGGYSGIPAGNQTMVICMQDSPGGTFAEVGNRYAFINQLKPIQIRFLPTYSVFPNPGVEGVIYVAQDTGVLYYWDADLGDYVVFGDVVYGDYINPTTFEVSGVPVEPDGSKLYIDLTTDNKYRWNGEVFLQINESGGGGGVDWSNLTHQKHLKFNGFLNKPVNSNAADTTDGVEITGLVKTNGVQLNNFTGTPLPNQITRNGDKLKYTNPSGITKDIAMDEQVYKTISGNVTLDDSYHNAICWITANAIITVPSTLRADFNCVFDAIGTVAGTFTEGAGVTFSAPLGKILKNNGMCTLYKIASDNYRLNGNLIPS